MLASPGAASGGRVSDEGVCGFLLPQLAAAAGPGHGQRLCPPGGAIVGPRNPSSKSGASRPSILNETLISEESPIFRAVGLELIENWAV